MTQRIDIPSVLDLPGRVRDQLMGIGPSDLPHRGSGHSLRVMAVERGYDFDRGPDRRRKALLAEGIGGIGIVGIVVLALIVLGVLFFVRRA
jgi:hypothetical protein